MSKGNLIVVSSNPKGVFLEGTIDDTSKPGTLMQIEAKAFLNGEPFWQAASIGTDGFPALIAVLREDILQGFLPTQAYVSGTRCFLYCPAMGEDVNVLVGEGAGTANTFAIGDYFMLDSDAGVLIPASGSPASRPFQCMETVTQVAGSNLTWCKYTGH
jgi:hypothetical protein